jgi:hypothetical protein
MGYNLFLDDMRWPRDTFLYTSNKMYLDMEWDIAMNYDQFVDAVKKRGIPDVVSFDHDLAEEHYENKLPYDQYNEKTGYDCAKWLIDYCIDHNKDIPKIVLIHSLNVPGSKNIESLFYTYEKLYRRT